MNPAERSLCCCATWKSKCCLLFVFAAARAFKHSATLWKLVVECVVRVKCCKCCPVIALIQFLVMLFACLRDVERNLAFTLHDFQTHRVHNKIQFEYVSPLNLLVVVFYDCPFKVHCHVGCCCCCCCCGCLFERC